jgi:DNA polymerase III delta subunit
MLVQVREAIEDGASRNDQDLGRYLGLHPFVVRKVLRQVDSFRQYDYRRMLEYLMEADVRLKRGTMSSKPEGRLALEMLITKLAETRITSAPFEPSY